MIECANCGFKNHEGWVAKNDRCWLCQRILKPAPKIIYQEEDDYPDPDWAVM